MALGLKNSRVLFVSANSYPPFAGDSLFSFGIIKSLNLHNNITVLTLSSFDENTENELLNVDWINTSEIGDWAKHIVRYVRNGSFSLIGPVHLRKDIVHEKWDCVVIDHLRSYGMISHVLSKLKYSHLYYLAHNIESFNRKQKISFSNSLKEKIIESLNRGIDRQEEKLIYRADKVFTLTDQDAFVLRNMFLKKDVLVQSPIYPFKRKKRQTTANGILLIGSLNWFPNRLGVNDFLASMTDDVLKNRPVFIVGSYPIEFKKRWEKENINFCGFVEDLDIMYEKCEYLVVPNIYGTGIKMKVFDGLNNGLKVLAVKESAVGYSINSYKDLFVFSDVNEIIDFLVE